MAGAFCLSSEYVFFAHVGGLPRAFGYPVAACAVYGVASGRAGILACAVLAGAALYPASAVAPGVALALVCLMFPTATAFAALLIVLPPLIGAREYGGLISSADVMNYP